MKTPISFRNRLRKRSLRSEAGAGGLLPIITIGMMIVIVAASIAGSTAFAAKISGQQLAQTRVDMEIKSMLTVATTNLSKTTTPEPTVTVEGSGRYTLYASAADTPPATDADPSAKGLVKGYNVPAGTKWILMRMRPLSQNTDVKFAVFRYYAQGAPVLDNAIRWNGGVNITSSDVSTAPGNTGAQSITVQNTANGRNLSLANSTISADIYADYPSEVQISGGALHGSVSSKGSVLLSGGTATSLLGDVLSGNAINGEADIAGKRQANTSVTLTPWLPLQSYNLGLYTQRATLGATDCNTASKLKAKLESYTQETAIDGLEKCAASSWKMDIKPNANLLLYSTENLTIDSFSVSNTKGTVGIASSKILTLKNVNYKVGASGFFLARDSMAISNSDLTGSISNFGSAPGGQLDISQSKIAYTPVFNPLMATCGGSNCAMSSTSIHIVRVS